MESRTSLFMNCGKMRTIASKKKTVFSFMGQRTMRINVAYKGYIAMWQPEQIQDSCLGARGPASQILCQKRPHISQRRFPYEPVFTQRIGFITRFSRKKRVHKTHVFRRRNGFMKAMLICKSEWSSCT